MYMNILLNIVGIEIKNTILQWTLNRNLMNILHGRMHSC